MIMSISPRLLQASDSPTWSNTACTLDFHGIRCGKDILDLDEMEIATMLSLAHLTGWSAELIANKLHKLLDTDITPELVWVTYKDWRDMRDENRLDGSRCAEDLKINRTMVDVLECYGIEPNYFARALSQTPSPISVKFSGLWYPKKDECALLEDFTEVARQRSLTALCWRPSEIGLAKLTQGESEVLRKLGEHVTSIVEDLLQRWMLEMSQINKKIPFSRVIEVCPFNIQIIERYSKQFEHDWEAVFGKMDVTRVSWLPLPANPQVYHNLSTGHVSKTFFTLMLYTRLETMQERRRIWRSIVGYQPISLKELPEDVQDCVICQHPLGVPDDDGLIEMPIQVVACCGNYFGSKCLRRWFGEFENAKCPLCNCTASPEFLHRLFYNTVEDSEEVNAGHDKDSSRAHMGSVRPHNSNVDDRESDHRQSDADPYTVEQDEIC